MNLDDMLRKAYTPMMQDAIKRGDELAEKMEAEREVRRAAMTPEQRELEDLRNRVAELEERLRHAKAALDGEECGYSDW